MSARKPKTRLGGRLWVGRRPSQNYRGRQILADTDLHERALTHVQRHALAGGRVADVGCGEGAFAYRLADAGFDVVGLDTEPATHHPAGGGYTYEQVDLHSPAARDGFLSRYAGTFDTVVLLEVIEHVHDPWQALEFCQALLRPGGTLVLSTPNITSFFSRFRFLTGGRLHQFEPGDFTYGHINPMTALMVAKVLDDTGFDLLEKHPGPRIPVVVWDTSVASIPGRLLHAASFLVAAALTPLMRGGDLRGWTLFFIARKREDPPRGE